MQVAQLFLAVLLVATCAAASPARQLTTSNTQAVSTLQQSLTVLVGGISVTDITLSGTVHRIAGGDDEIGTVILKALSTGEARVDSSYPSGQISEIWKYSGNLENTAAGQWSGVDGQIHSIPLHNLLIDSSWFFPPMVLTRYLSIPGYNISVGSQTSFNGEPIEDISISLIAATLPPAVAPLYQHLSSVDIYLSVSTGLPVAFCFATHPDNNASSDIPVQILYSDYRAVGGIQVPFHIQKYLNNNLALDIQIQSAAVNSGLLASAFALQ